MRTGLLSIAVIFTAGFGSSSFGESSSRKVDSNESATPLDRAAAKPVASSTPTLVLDPMFPKSVAMEAGEGPLRFRISASLVQGNPEAAPA